MTSPHAFSRCGASRYLAAAVTRSAVSSMVSGRCVGAEHCHVHLTTTEQQRREQLRTAREKVRQAEEDAVECQRVVLAHDWIDRYGRRPHRVELPTLPSRPH
ncbi:hypothetical protein ABT061_29120 [Streptosporangium sp. NPDC002544]|uniref:hypothetical protein n=1 Tax=Streptosporangium sp. NPDC002544 TaxID=3154538 RepID=UPI003328847B